MNEPGTQWTAMRAMCDLADCCHGEAVSQLGAAGFNYSYLITSYSDEAYRAQHAKNERTSGTSCSRKKKKKKKSLIPIV